MHPAAAHVLTLTARPQEVDAMPRRLAGARPFRTRPDRMTARARFYLLSTFVTHFALAVLCLVVPQTFTSPSFEVVILGAPLWLSGLVFGTAAVVSGIAALVSSPGLARIGLGISFVAAGTWTVGLLGAVVLGDPAGYTAPIVWAALAAKDALQCLVPQRVALEPVIRDVIAASPRTDTTRG